MIGLTNLGEINNYLLAFEQSLNELSLPGSLARTVLTFMARGIFTSLKYSYTHFFCASITEDLMVQPFKAVLLFNVTVGLGCYF